MKKRQYRTLVSALIAVGVQVKGSRVLLLCHVHVRKPCMLCVKHPYKNKYNTSKLEKLSTFS